MTPEERLKEIRERWQECVDDHDNPLNWHPVTELPAFQALEQEIARLNRHVDHAEAAYSEVLSVSIGYAKEIGRLREALKFYADPENWYRREMSDSHGPCYIGAYEEGFKHGDDQGQKARQALEE
jgi:hypothetical protein